MALRRMGTVKNSNSWRRGRYERKKAAWINLREDRYSIEATNDTSKLKMVCAFHDKGNGGKSPG